MIKPFKIALLLVFIQVSLGLIIYFIPDEGINVIDGISISFSKPKDFYEDKLREIKVVEEISQQYSKEELSEDTLLASNIDSSLLQEAIVLEESERIIHPSDFENGLYSFYHKLGKLNKLEKPLRILHFGDSQLEGDRISGVIRENLQTLFGGCGVGFIPISETNTGRLNVLKKERGWERYQVFGKGRKGTHSKYGFLGYYYRIGKDSLIKKHASIELRKNWRYFKKAQDFETFSVLYGNAKDSFQFKLNNDTGILAMGNLAKTNYVNQKIWQVDGFNQGEISLSFNALNSPDFYGISLDCKQGIALDNIALRGSSGTEFTRMNKEYLTQQLKGLNVGLIIYQFGLNVVGAELKSYKYYENKIYGQLKLLKEILPDASILVISVTDACKNEEESFAYIDRVRDAQKLAAKRANCSFWDLYEVMGGKLSMPSWVNASPSLAEKDFMHFNVRGSKVVGKKLFNAIISDYNDFKSSSIN